MNKKQRKRLCKYIQFLATEVGLSEWRFVLLAEHADEDTLAQTMVIPHRQIAKMRFCPEWSTLPHMAQKATVLHELMHCHSAQLTHVINSVETNIGETAFGIFNDCFNAQEELMVDNISTAWARHIDDSTVLKYLKG